MNVLAHGNRDNRQFHQPRCGQLSDNSPIELGAPGAVQP
jgi:hypothetical protein